jgi:hypothetical protein
MALHVDDSADATLDRSSDRKCDLPHMDLGIIVFTISFESGVFSY